jgi:hypothetical protein
MTGDETLDSESLALALTSVVGKGQRGSTPTDVPDTLTMSLASYRGSVPSESNRGSVASGRGSVPMAEDPEQTE